MRLSALLLSLVCSAYAIQQGKTRLMWFGSNQKNLVKTERPNQTLITRVVSSSVATHALISDIHCECEKCSTPKPVETCHADIMILMDASVCHAGEPWARIRKFGVDMAQQLERTLDVQNRYYPCHYPRVTKCVHLAKLALVTTHSRTRWKPVPDLIPRTKRRGKTSKTVSCWEETQTTKL